MAIVSCRNISTNERRNFDTACPQGWEPVFRVGDIAPAPMNGFTLVFLVAVVLLAAAQLLRRK